MTTPQSHSFTGSLAFAPPHPGEFVLEDCLKPLGLSIAKGAAALGVTRASLNNIVRGKSAVSAEMAVRLSQVFGSSPTLWLKLQAAHDLAKVAEHGHIHLVRFKQSFGDNQVGAMQ
jgi:addiction module HigA family antidote